MCNYSNDIIKLEDLDIDNIVIEEKSHENILFMTFHIEHWLDSLEFMMELDI